MRLSYPFFGGGGEGGGSLEQRGSKAETEDATAMLSLSNKSMRFAFDYSLQREIGKRKLS